MGTRQEDQPVDHWAGPGSLDPTPVWKQYLLVAIFVLLTLGLVAVVAYSALAVELATPPASVIGGRVVLARSDVPGVGAPPKLYGAPLVDAAHAFYLVQYRKGEFVALRAAALRSIPPTADLDVLIGVSAGGPPATIDRYLVSVEGAKVIVNTSRVISGTEVVPAPSPSAR